MAILTFKVKGQTLTVESKINKIVENSVNYLDYEIIYDDKKWDPPLAKKIVVTYDKKTYEIFGDKIAILFDANDYTRDRMHLFGNQQLRFAEQLEKFSHRLSVVEKAVFVKN